MAIKQKTSGNIDQYIAGFPQPVQTILEKLRKTIKKAAPQADEAFCYGIPTFDLDGKHLVHFAAFQSHIGFYPTPSGISKFKTEIAGYQSAKGSVKFPLNQPIPYGLVQEIVRFRVAEIARSYDNKNRKQTV